MSNVKQLLGGLAAVGLIAVAAPAQAVPSITLVTDFGTQSVDPFSGIDWTNTASAVTSGFNVGAGLNVWGSTFSTVYAASAEAVKTAGNTAPLIGLSSNGISAPVNWWEITTVATLLEQARCTAVSGTTCTNVEFRAVSGGTFDIWYDRDADSDRTTGAGFSDGVKIIGGSINAGNAGSFAGDGINGTGNFTFDGVVTFTETNNLLDAYINPALVSSGAVATLQLGTNTNSGWTPPTSWIGGIPTGALIFQADGNQGFSVIPEPASLALVGLGLLGLGGLKRRNRNK